MYNINPTSYETEKFFYATPDTKASNLFEKYAHPALTLKQQQTYIALDLEMSGLNPVKDKIIQIGWIPMQFSDNKFRIKKGINTNIDVPHVNNNVLKLTELTQTDLNHAPKLQQILPQLNLNQTFIGHHLSTDLEFLFMALNLNQQEIVQCHYLDSFYLANKKLNLHQCKNHKLQTLKDYYKIEAPMHHAYYDAISSALIYYYIQNDIKPEQVSRINLTELKPAEWIEIMNI